MEKCNAIHRSIVEQFRTAIVYGKSVKHQPQRVGLSHELADEDIGTHLSTDPEVTSDQTAADLACYSDDCEEMRDEEDVSVLRGSVGRDHRAVRGRTP